jgi:hypothetical protein
VEAKEKIFAEKSSNSTNEGAAQCLKFQQMALPNPQFHGVLLARLFIQMQGEELRSLMKKLEANTFSRTKKK